MLRFCHPPLPPMLRFVIPSLPPMLLFCHPTMSHRCHPMLCFSSHRCHQVQCYIFSHCYLYPTQLPTVSPLRLCISVIGATIQIGKMDRHARSDPNRSSPNLSLPAFFFEFFLLGLLWSSTTDVVAELVERFLFIAPRPYNKLKLKNKLFSFWNWMFKSMLLFSTSAKCRVRLCEFYNDRNKNNYAKLSWTCSWHWNV